MTYIVDSCPNCGAEHIALHVVTSRKINEAQVNLFIQCPTCKEPSGARIKPSRTPKATADWFSRTNGNVDLLEDSGWQVEFWYPEKSEVGAPSDTPEDIARIFIQARQAHRRGERDAAGIMYRKVLEASTKKLLPSSSKPLAGRIDELSKAGRIPKEVGDWAHEIRVAGNEAAHETEEPTQEDIDEAGEFVEAFLIYIFSMPMKIQRRKSRKQS